MLTEADRKYVEANFIPLDRAAHGHGDDPATVRELIAAARLPRPSYVLDDGTEMVPPDYFTLVDEAGGVESLRDVFVARYAAAAAREGVPLDPAEDEWEGYLSGEYGVCLHRVSPETIARKSALVRELDALLDNERSDAADWRQAVRTGVDELHWLERPFAPDYDRIRFGGPSSRDRLITDVRARFPDLFADSAEAA
jgi:hypothetical protein